MKIFNCLNNINSLNKKTLLCLISFLEFLDKFYFPQVILWILENQFRWGRENKINFLNTYFQFSIIQFSIKLPLRYFENCFFSQQESKHENLISLWKKVTFWETILEKYLESLIFFPFWKKKRVQLLLISQCFHCC